MPVNKQSFSYRYRRSLRLIQTPPVLLQKRLKNMKAEDREDLAKQLRGLLELSARTLGYVENAHRGHVKAVKGFNRTLTNVRRVLGYTYPDRAGISFF